LSRRSRRYVSTIFIMAAFPCETIGFLHDEPAAQDNPPSGYDVRGQVKELLGVVANLREDYERTSAIGLFLALD
jgi:hypothetical protein